MGISGPAAKIVAVIYLAGGIGVLLKKINFKNIAEDLENSPALAFISGSLGVIIGMVLVEYHNIWVKNWTVLITIISWMLLAGGFAVIAFPKSLSYYSRFYKQSPVWGIIMICVGLLFGYFGLFC